MPLNLKQQGTAFTLSLKKQSYNTFHTKFLSYLIIRSFELPFNFVLKLNKIFSSEQLVETEKKYLFLSFGYGYIQAVNFKH